MRRRKVWASLGNTRGDGTGEPRVFVSSAYGTFISILPDEARWLAKELITLADQIESEATKIDANAT